MKNYIVKRLVFLALFTVLFVNLSAQESGIKISGGIENVPLTTFIQSLEENYNLKFYYQPETIDNKVVNLGKGSFSLNEALEQICRTNILQFYQKNNEIFLFRGEPLAELFEAQQIDSSPSELQKSQKDNDIEALRQKAFKVYTIGTPGRKNAGQATLSGYVTNFGSDDPVFNANVIVAGTSKGVSTNQKGYYEIDLPVGNNTLQFSSIGMTPTQRIVNIYSDGRLDVEMETKINIIGDIEIFGENKGEVSKVFSGVEQFKGEMLESLPALLGEPDVIKSTLMLPGVSTVGEGAIGFNVRGGKTDQNLILIDEAPVFYPSHFFGNFSAINSDIIDNAILYKGSMPSQYGGRISSVYEINTIDGGNEISGVGGIGLYSARFMIEGPLVKNTSFFLSSRSTYSDWLLDLFKVPELYNSEVGFNDIHGKINIELNKKNLLKLGAYTSNDRFKLRSDSLYRYQNNIATAQFEHKYSDNWQSDVDFAYSNFSYNISSKENQAQAFVMTHDVDFYGLKNYNEFRDNQKLKIYFGAESNWYKVNPGNLVNFNQSRIAPFNGLTENGLEYGVFAGSEFSLTPLLKLEAGIRWSGFLSFDDGTRYVYQANAPLDTESITDTITGENNKIKKHFYHPEYRLSANYTISEFTSLKFSYNKTTQYIHMLTNTTAISPTDTWKLSDEYLPPQIGHQVSAGIFKNFRRDDIEVSVEGFYKRIRNIKEYKPGASLVLNDHIETEILNGLGKAYGAELSVKKNGDRLNGWIGYTYSRTLIRSNSEFSEEQINDGDYFPASYDKPHTLNVFANLKASRRVLVSSTVNYTTGRPITYPVAKYKLGDKVLVHYSEFNQYRIPDYFRVDFSVTIKGNLKADKLFNSSTTFSVYNVTGRKNAYSVFYKSEGNKLEGYKLSIFGTAIPTITFNFEF